MLPRSLVLILSFAWVAIGQAADRDQSSFSIGTGSEGGFYFDFGDAIERASRQTDSAAVELNAIATDGSVDNLLRMQRGELDLAIVQNDVAYYVYEGIRGYAAFDDFRAGAPLFREYIQVLVAEDSDIGTLGELRNKTISLGPDGSGSYHNAVDLLAEAGFRSGVDFEPAYLNLTEALPRLLSGEIDAIIHTGSTFPVAGDGETSGIRPLSLSLELVRSMAARSPYYVSATPTFQLGQDTYSISTVSLTAFLVISDRVPNSDARAIIELIDQQSAYLFADLGRQIEVVPISETNSTKPVPLHRGVRAYLVEMGYVATDNTVYWLLLFGVSLIGLALYARARCSAYDRLGNVRSASGAWQYRFMLILSQFNSLLVVIVVFIAIVFVLVEAIQYFETQYARQYNIRNQFADIGFWDAVLWMFMFMGSGHTDDLFPLSSPGRILATTLPFLGIGSILGFMFLGFDQARERNAERKRGRLPVRIRNHVLVCGWNDKAKGIVYSLTSDDVPRKKHAVVVAEIDGDMPLEGHDFNPRYVSYLRGDSADHTVLARANIEHASAAVVVAGLKKRAGKNVRSILSVMALKETFSGMMARKGIDDRELFVAAELLFDENRSLFHACGADAIVTAETVANRVAAQCCVNPHVVDLLLDALTYDAASELYSTRIEKIGRKTGIGKILSAFPIAAKSRDADDAPLSGMRLQDIRRGLADYGINVVGAARNRDFTESFVGDIFDDDMYVFPQSRGRMHQPLRDEHVLLFFADDHDDIDRATLQLARYGHSSATEVAAPDTEQIIVPEMKSVLLVGDLERCNELVRLLEPVPWCTTSILTDSVPEGAQPQSSVVVGDFDEVSSWERAGLLDADEVMILAQSGEQANLGQVADDHGEIDARAIFAARFARQFFSQLAAKSSAGRPRPTIAAEMVGHKSKSLFSDAGVDIIVPSSLLVERMLTKLVYSKGAVCRFLMALLAFEDDRHILTIQLREDEHAALIGRSFRDLMFELPPEAQLLGVVPAPGKRRERMENTVEDFDYHVLTCPDVESATKYRSEAGDELLVILDRSVWNFGSSRKVTEAAQ